MLFSLQNLIGSDLKATDGRIGDLHDALFDDVAWTVRHLVADTGTWLPGRKVLIPPQAVGRPDVTGRILPVDLTRQQIEKSPPIEEDEPVSRAKEESVLTYYGWEPYWPVAIPHPTPAEMETQPVGAEETEQAVAVLRKQNDPDLRSTREAIGYHIQATDGEIGHVEDFIVEDQTWSVRYMVVDTRNWLPGRKVLISPNWIDQISWNQRPVAVQLTQDQVRNSPRYDPSAPVNRAYEEKLYDFYGRPVYWEEKE